jgi:hypothetical protein
MLAQGERLLGWEGELGDDRGFGTGFCGDCRLRQFGVRGR